MSDQPPYRPDRWFFIGDTDLEPAEFCPLEHSWQLDLNPPRGWTRVSYEHGFIPIIHVNSSNHFALEALNRLLDEESISRFLQLPR